jgi:hypothetical protein
MKQKAQFGPWLIEFNLDDGGRLDRLAYNNINLLTVEPDKFQPPHADYGEYETRPVYGYDDCFPTVETCKFPGSDWEIPDHGEVCWLPWEVKKNSDVLTFIVTSKKLPAKLTRKMNFSRDKLIWSFSVENNGKDDLPFQHVMHPLMPLKDITNIELPDYELVYDDINKKALPLEGRQSIQSFILSQPSGSTQMLFLQHIKEGRMSWEYLNNLGIEAQFSKELFPSIGIWWNNNKYPDEENCRRNECALEPIPGSNSRLSDAFQEGTCLVVHPGEQFDWQIIWEIKS